MKLQKTFRAQLVIFGFAAALFMASSVRAQEIDNTSWADSASVVPFDQAATGTTAQISKAATAATTKVTTAALGVEAAATSAKPVVASANVLSPWTQATPWLTALSIVCILLGVLYARSDSKRNSRSAHVRNHHTKRSVALS
jgi:hypothetical protein